MIYSIPLSTSVPSPLKRPFDPFKRVRSAITKNTSLSQSDSQVVRVARVSDSLAFRNLKSIPYKIEDGYYTLVFSLGGFIIAVAEENYNAMVEDLKDQIKDAWEYYACESDDNLTKGAQQVKQWLRHNVIEVS